MTTTNETTKDLCIDPIHVNRHVQELLAKHHSIAAIWHIDDVKCVRPHLTEEQAWEVFQQVGDIHDAEWGVCWTTLETVADDMFPAGQKDGGSHEA
ncbi:MAG TPA: hypothetical protein VE988_20640 [Gemmataceae bacterium]|nr:hypothetical protein [Gemmataceae bacterium]